MGLIFAENPEVNLGDLTKGRSLAAVPVGGRYRIIDFVLSLMRIDVVLEKREI